MNSCCEFMKRLTEASTHVAIEYLMTWYKALFINKSPITMVKPLPFLVLLAGIATAGLVCTVVRVALVGVVVQAGLSPRSGEGARVSLVVRVVRIALVRMVIVVGGCLASSSTSSSAAASSAASFVAWHV